MVTPEGGAGNAMTLRAIASRIRSAVVAGDRYDVGDARPQALVASETLSGCVVKSRWGTPGDHHVRNATIRDRLVLWCFECGVCALPQFLS